MTHDQVEAMTMATRIVVMNNGAIQQVGAPQELYDRPLNLFVAGTSLAYWQENHPRDRPENIHGRRFMPPDINACFLEADIEVTELMGNEIILFLLASERQFQARVDPRTEARPGQRIEIALDIDRVHMFDAETEQVIGLPTAEERRETMSAAPSGSE